MRVARNDPMPVAATNTTAMPSPAKPVPFPVWRTITSTSSELIPNTPRWAASADNVDATDGVVVTARAP